MRTLGTLSGIALAAIGCGARRVSHTLLDIYHDLRVPETWRQQALSWLASPWILALVVLASATIIVAMWRLPTNTAGWFSVCAVFLTWLTLVGAGWFYLSIFSYPAMSMGATTQ